MFFFSKVIHILSFEKVKKAEVEKSKFKHIIANCQSRFFYLHMSINYHEHFQRLVQFNLMINGQLG